MRKDTTPTVDLIDAMSFVGNTIPHAWLKHPDLRLKSGFLNLPAVMILADIIYWYRATHIRDERTGDVTQVRKRFHSDMLQKRYDEWGPALGMTKGQAQDACYFLKERGLINVIMRPVKTEKGTVPNAVFFEPIPEAIARINRLIEDSDDDQPILPPATAGHENVHSGRRRTPQRDNTETTPKSTSETTAFDSPLPPKTKSEGLPSTPAATVKTPVPSKDEKAKELLRAFREIRFPGARPWLESEWQEYKMNLRNLVTDGITTEEYQRATRNALARYTTKNMVNPRSVAANISTLLEEPTPPTAAQNGYAAGHQQEPPKPEVVLTPEQIEAREKARAAKAHYQEGLERYRLQEQKLQAERDALMQIEIAKELEKIRAKKRQQEQETITL